MDLDDGGGGSKKAGERYMKMWEKHYNIESQLDSDVRKKVKNELNKKYGQKAMKKYYRNQNIKSGIALTGALLGAGAATVLTVEATKAGAKLIGKGVKKGAKFVYNSIKSRVKK